MKEEIALVTSEPTKSLGLVDFWRRFRLFASPFEEFCFRYWYIIFFGYSIALALLDLLLDWRQGINLSVVFSQSGDQYHHMVSFVKSDAINVQLISEAVGLVLVALTFRLWSRGVAPLFQYFYDKGRICSMGSTDKVDPQEYARFLQDYQRALVSPKRQILLGTLLVSMVVLMLLVILPRIGAEVASRGTDRVYLVFWLIRWPGLLIIFSGTALAYYMALGIWSMIVTGLYIRKLTTEFHLIIQPRHPDNCGGLKKLGDFCFSLALPILVAALFLSIYGIGFVLAGRGGFVVVTSNIILFLLALPLAALAFFVPLWSIHLRMVEQKRESEEDFSHRVTLLEKRIYTFLTAGEVDKARTAKDELEIVQYLRPEKIEYPLWPFDRRLFLTYLVPHIVPLFSLLVSTNADSPLAGVLKTVLHFIAG
ncbi:MAG TPA: hypothetical protein VF458_04995 [Ktedonobacteraceae bacterium]